MILRPRPVVALAVLVLLGWLALGPLHRALRTVAVDVRALRGAGREREALPAGAPLPSLAGLRDWVGRGPTRPVAPGARLTVVVVFSDTRPGSLDLLPRLEELHEGFAAAGLRVLGVLAPEFSFAADTAATARLARRLGLGFPIALDPARAYERACGGPDVRGRPRLVVADGAGRVVADSAALDDGCVRRAIARFMPEVPIAPASPAPEDPGEFIALGAGRLERGPLARAEVGLAATYTAQFRYQEQGQAEVPYPVGRWRSEAEGLTALRGGAAQFVAIRYDAARSGPARMGVVMSPPREGPVRVWVLRDESWLPREALGADARLDGRGASYVDVSEPRLYRVARGGGVFKLSPEQPGVTFHAFTLEPAR